LELADRIDRANGCSLHMSVGVNQGPFGTLAYVALHAIAFVTKNLDRRGGLLFHPLAVRGADFARRLGLFSEQRTSRVGGFTSVMDTLPGGILADEILTEGEDRVRALVVVSGDPLLSIPGGARLRDALRALDLLVVIDLFENTTGREAHLLL